MWKEHLNDVGWWNEKLEKLFSENWYFNFGYASENEWQKRYVSFTTVNELVIEFTSGSTTGIIPDLEKVEFLSVVDLMFIAAHEVFASRDLEFIELIDEVTKLGSDFKVPLSEYIYDEIAEMYILGDISDGLFDGSKFIKE